MNASPPEKIGTRSRSGFSLVEVMCALAVLLILVVTLMTILSNTTRVLGKAQGSGEAMRAAQAGFDTLRRTLAQVTLNSYWGYNSPTAPTEYVRLSELHFVSGSGAQLTGLADARTHAVFFQAALGFADPSEQIKNGVGTAASLHNALNANGYFVEFGSDSLTRPEILENAAARRRFRLMQFLEPTTKMSVYDHTNPAFTGNPLGWFRGGLTARTHLSVLAENIVALIVLPKLAENPGVPSADPFKLVKGVSESWGANQYNYDTRQGAITADTRNFLPPVVRVIVVAIDEASATRLHDSATTMPFDLDALNLFRTTASEAGLRDDLATLEDILNAKPGNAAGNTIRCDYRIFETDIPLADSK